MTLSTFFHLFFFSMILSCFTAKTSFFAIKQSKIIRKQLIQQSLGIRLKSFYQPQAYTTISITFLNCNTLVWLLSRLSWLSRKSLRNWKSARGVVSTQPLCNNQELIYTIPKHNGERIVHRRETRHSFLYSCGFRIGWWWGRLNRPHTINSIQIHFISHSLALSEKNM